MTERGHGPGLPFSQVDVFGSPGGWGNPVAVVHDADGLSTAQMQAFANWTNLSETTFLLRPESESADYRVRIFTPAAELPFAGHPTLGSAHAWLSAGGTPRAAGGLVQECGVGSVGLRRDPEGRLSFAAPPLIRSGPPDDVTLTAATAALGVEPSLVLGAAWVDNGPGWLGLRLDSARTVLGLVPDLARFDGLEIGVIGAYDAAGRDETGADVEVRAFVPSYGIGEDPVTGSLNASLAQWLIGDGALPRTYVASQGTCLGRAGRVFVEQVDDQVWVGGATRTLVTGTADPSRSSSPTGRRGQ
ncbi:MAG: PhzF family phenazine biosynthesis protein [Nocardioides sp.]